jgi:hypothetical protein
MCDTPFEKAEDIKEPENLEESIIVSGSLPPDHIGFLREYRESRPTHVKLEVPAWFTAVLIVDGILLIFDIITMILK